jgi:hypothetical protein
MVQIVHTLRVEDFRILRVTSRLSATRFAAIVAILLACSCGFTKKRAAAEEAVQLFHERFDAGQDDEIYDAADAEYKQALTKDANHSFLSRLRRTFGNRKQSEETRWFVNSTTQGTFVSLEYRSKCANGEMIERFVWRVKEDHATLAGFHVESPLLQSEPKQKAPPTEVPRQV